MLMPTTIRQLAWLVAAVLIGAAPAAAQSVKARYEAAQRREAEVRPLLAGGEATPAQRSEALRQVSRLVSSYEGIVRAGFDVPEGTVFGPPPGSA